MNTKLLRITLLAGLVSGPWAISYGPISSCSGALVKRADQRDCFWQEERSREAVLAVVPRLAQVIQFLDSGERGPNIGTE
jgi:hypothetical protein